MMRVFAMAGNSCLAIRSLIVFLTMFCSMEVRSLSTFAKEVYESCRKALITMSAALITMSAFFWTF